MVKTLRMPKKGNVVSSLVALVAVVFLASVAGNADAGAQPTDEMQVSAVVARHMNAVKRADKKAFARVWDTKHGRSTGIDGTSIRVEPIMKAFGRWAARPDKAMTWKVDSVDVVGKRMATVKLRMTWHGQKRVEVLTLISAGGQWKLSGKTHMAVSKPRKVRTGGY